MYVEMLAANRRRLEWAILALLFAALRYVLGKMGDFLILLLRVVAPPGFASTCLTMVLLLFYACTVQFFMPVQYLNHFALDSRTAFISLWSIEQVK